MTRINTNVQSMRGLRNVQRANTLLNTSLSRLSTGLKINSGKDDPAGLIAGESLRLQVTTIETSIKNSNRANNVISTADSALGEIGGLLNQIRGLVQEGLNSGALSQDEIKANQLQIDAALSAINRISSNTTFAGDKLIDGSKAFKTQLSTTDAAKINDLQINEAIFGSSSSIPLEVSITTAAEQGELRYSGGNLSGAVTLEVAGAKGSQVLNLGTGSTVAQVRDAVNAAKDVTGVEATISGGYTFTTGAVASKYEQRVADGATFTSGGTNTLTFTDKRVNGSGTISVVLGTTTNSNASSTVSSVTTNAAGNTTITIDLADDGTTSTATGNDILSAIAANAGASALVDVSQKTTGSTDVFAAASQTLGGGDTLTLSRATAGSNETLGGRVFVEFKDPNANSQSLSLDSVTTNSYGDTYLTFTLGTDASGNISSTAADISTLLNNGSALSNRALQYVDVNAGSGSRALTATSAPVELTGGHDGLNSDIAFTDLRSDTSTALNVQFANSGNANDPLSIGVSQAANGDYTITINVATDASGNTISTAGQIADAIKSDQNVNFLLGAAASGNGSEVVGVNTSTTTAAQDVAASNGLVFTSTGYGSQQYVELNVLSGTFDTTDKNAVATRRDSGTDVVATINGQAAQGDGLRASVKTARLDASVTFQEAANTNSNTATINVIGGGSLFQIGQQATSAGQIGVGIDAINTARLGGLTGKLYELGTGGGKSLLDVGPSVQSSDLVDIVEQALNRVSTLRGRLGAIQKNVIETNITTLGVALENISEARSQIVDTDFAEETANMTKAQVLSQAGLSVLAIANQNPQQVLSLLR